jgi:hypothetical protein
MPSPSYTAPRRPGNHIQRRIPAGRGIRRVQRRGISGPEGVSPEDWISRAQRGRRPRCCLIRMGLTTNGAPAPFVVRLRAKPCCKHGGCRSGGAERMRSVAKHLGGPTDKPVRRITRSACATRDLLLQGRQPGTTATANPAELCGNPASLHAYRLRTFSDNDSDFKR